MMRERNMTTTADMQETTMESMKKRMPWLVLLLFLGMGVSSVVGMFEMVAAVLPVVICFQSLILDMAGNVGTQSLAVTIRVLADENMDGGQKFRLVSKELKVGFINGMMLGSMAFIFTGPYISMLKHYPILDAELIAGCIGIALMVSMAISSLVGTLIPIFFSRIGIDPAAASGPLITTVNDLTAVIVYYGLVWMLLIQVLHLAG
jgi:magnesium transporter